MRGIIIWVPIMVAIYALTGVVVYVARSHAQRGELGISMGAPR